MIFDPFHIHFLRIKKLGLFLLILALYMFVPNQLSLSAQETQVYDVSPTAITVPAVSITQVSFTGSPVGIDVPLNEAYTITSTQAINVGDYEAVLSLVTPASYTWDDATTEDKTITWAITPKIITPPAVGITQFAFSSFDNYPDILAYPGSQSTSQLQSQAGIYTWTIELVDAVNTRFANTTRTAIDFQWEITPMIVSVPAVGVTEFAFTGFLNRPEVSVFPGSEATGDMVSHVGIHTYTVELLDPPNMRFSNGTNAAFNIPWSITRGVITIPSITVTRFAFTGDLNRPALEIFPGSQGSSDLVSEVGIHTYTVELIDPDNTIFSNGTTSAFTVEWEIFPLTAITKPSIGVTRFGFTGFLNQPEVVIYDETSLTGTTIASEAGIYTAYAQVNNPDQIQFVDGTTQVAIQWEITPMIISKPAVVVTSFAFGNVIHEVGAFVRPGSTMTHATGVSVGAYTATVSLDYPGNQTWPDGTSDPIEIPWEINPLIVSLPAILVTQYAFQGADNYPLLEVFPGSESTGMPASQVGIYTYTVELIDSENSVFSDGSTDPVEITWEITPLVVSVPAVLVTQFAFNGFDNYPGVEVYPGSVATSELASQVGIHTYVIELQDPNNLVFSNGSTDPIQIEWEITPMIVETPEIQVTSFAFNGEVLGPQNPSLPVTREAISSTDVGIYTVKYSVIDPKNMVFDDGSTEVLIDYAITKAIIDASDWMWNYDSVFSFTGEIQSVELMNVPEFVEVIYENHQASQPGIYTANARFVYDTSRISISNPPSVLEWEIFQKTSINIPNNLPEILIYDGTEQIPSIPSIDGVSVSVSAQTVPGAYAYTLILDDPRQTEWSDGSIAPITYPFYIEKRPIDLSNVELSRTQFVVSDITIELEDVPDFVEARWTPNTNLGSHILDIEWIYDEELVIITEIPRLNYTVLPERLTIHSFEGPTEIIPGQSIVFSSFPSKDHGQTIETMLQEESLVSNTIQVVEWNISDPTLDANMLFIQLAEGEDYAIYDGEYWQRVDSSEPLRLGEIELIARLSLEPAPTPWIPWLLVGLVSIGFGVFLVIRKYH